MFIKDVAVPLQEAELVGTSSSNSDAGLIVNVAKSTFCALEIEYLGYVLTRDGIKPQSNKVHAILRIKPHTESNNSDTS